VVSVYRRAFFISAMPYLAAFAVGLAGVAIEGIIEEFAVYLVVLTLIGVVVLRVALHSGSACRECGHAAATMFVAIGWNTLQGFWSMPPRRCVECDADLSSQVSGQ
jgi:hypothetical protein